MAIFDVIIVFARLLWPDIKESVDWIVGASAVWVFAYGVYWDIHLRRCETHYFLLWEIEKLRRGLHDPDLNPPLRLYDLFSESEKQSGERSANELRK